jgi:hypothetical protein
MLCVSDVATTDVMTTSYHTKYLNSKIFEKRILLIRQHNIKMTYAIRRNRRSPEPRNDRRSPDERRSDEPLVSFFFFLLNKKTQTIAKLHIPLRFFRFFFNISCNFLTIVIKHVKTIAQSQYNNQRELFRQKCMIVRFGTAPIVQRFVVQL